MASEGMVSVSMDSVVEDVIKQHGTRLSDVDLASRRAEEAGFFPLSLAVVDSENDDNWQWFMEHLKIIVDPGRIFTFISDRHSGLLKSIPNVFPDSYHSYCYYHLKLNMTSAISSKDRRRPFVIKKFKQLLYASTHKVFQIEYEKFVNLGCQQATNFLGTIPFENWANAYFPGHRYGRVSSSVAESFNSWVLKERQLPITSMLDSIRRKLMMKFAENKEVSRKWNSVLCPSMEKKLAGQVEAARTMKLIRSSDVLFEVIDDIAYAVDLSLFSCSCNRWHIDGFPCSHAVACITSAGRSLYDFCDAHFLSSTFRATYNLSIQPILMTVDDDQVTENAAVLPPEYKRPPGRPKRNRFENQGSSPKRTMKCSRCNLSGHHNKSTCNANIE